jgi:hypothetical protein
MLVPRLLAHYLPWYESSGARGPWGWHWTMNRFDPARRIDRDRPEIASHYTPRIGLYDSGDPAVIECHFLWMKLAGIDGVLVDWYGRATLYDYPQIHRNTAALFPIARRLNLSIGICYEDQTVPALIAAKKLADDAQVAHVRETLDWLTTHWFRDPAYLRLKGLPVLLSFGAGGLTDAQWSDVLVGRAKTLHYFSEHRRRPSATGAFDWPVPADYPACLERFYRESSAWPDRIPATYPRFHDIYAEAKVHDSYGRIPDDEGKTLERTLIRARESGAALVQLATWNDWGEGTQIEPSVEFGRRDLETIQRLFRTQIKVRPTDLELPERLLALRRRPDGRRPDAATLDRIARLLATGAIGAGRKLLERCEGTPSTRLTDRPRKHRRDR